jgi:hypothetical protein
MLPRIAPLVEPKPFQLCSLRGFFTVLGLPEPWSTATYAISAILVCAWLLRLWKTRSFDVAFACLLIASVLIAPHATVYDLVLLAPAFILLANAGIADRQGTGMWAAMYAAYLLPFMAGLVQALHVQLASPVLLLLMRAGAGIDRRDTEAPRPRSSQRRDRS